MLRLCLFFFFKQKTAYEMRISDWSSDVCSSDLPLNELRRKIKARDIDNLMPLDANLVPHEVVPMVRAVNHHIGLYRQVLGKQAQFLADASHQLRTPLAIMRTQAQYAKREPDIARTREIGRAHV